ncbi:MAG: precorrin-8X methylmutase [Spirochaetales bacterium]|nr:precorrin-8X methylmutase [Spirochaetales bacterium]
MKKDRQYIEPDEIYRRSFSLIREAFGDRWPDEPEREIIKRIAHTTADVDFALTFQMSPDAIVKGVEAIRAGKGIVTDVSMVMAGIRKEPLAKYGCPLNCLLYDEGVAEEAAKRGTTKAAVAIGKAAPLYEGGIVSIGNAPTALFELIDLVKAGKAAPALIVGVPVGFVGAAESKIELIESGIPFISNPSKRGGSPIAATIVNGLCTLAARS